MSDPQPPVPPVPSSDGSAPYAPPAYGATPPPAGPTPPPAQPAYPAYGQQPAQGYYAPPTNTLAILALVFAFVIAPGGIICGHIALGQIKRTGEGGKGLATAGLVIGYIFTGIFLLYIIGVIIFAIWAASMGAAYSTY
jgi:hypothetical protein